MWQYPPVFLPGVSPSLEMHQAFSSFTHGPVIPAQLLGAQNTRVIDKFLQAFCCFSMPMWRLALVWRLLLPYESGFPCVSFTRLVSDTGLSLSRCMPLSCFQTLVSLGWLSAARAVPTPCWLLDFYVIYLVFGVESWMYSGIQQMFVGTHKALQAHRRWQQDDLTFSFLKAEIWFFLSLK